MLDGSPRMELPSSDEVASQPRRGIAAGCNILFLTIILLLVAVLAFAAWLTYPADTPNPSATGNPSGPPSSNGG